MPLKTIKVTPAGPTSSYYLDMVLCLCLLGLLNMTFFTTVPKAFPCTFLLYWCDAIVSPPYPILANCVADHRKQQKIIWHIAS